MQQVDRAIKAACAAGPRRSTEIFLKNGTPNSELTCSTTLEPQKTTGRIGFVFRFEWKNVCHRQLPGSGQYAYRIIGSLRRIRSTVTNASAVTALLGVPGCLQMALAFESSVLSKDDLVTSAQVVLP